MGKKLVIYDCDGVIFDSREAVFAYYDFLCESFSIPKIDRDDNFMVESAMVKTNEEIINLLTEDKDLVCEMLEFAKRQNFIKFIDLMKPEKNILETLQRLKDRGNFLAVFTNRGSSLTYLLENFGMAKYFDFTVNSFDVVNPKPDPEGLYKIFEYFALDNNDAIFIGDSMNDYIPAKKTNTFFVAFKNRLLDAPVIYDHLDILEML